MAKIKKIRYWLRNFFGFSKVETNGFIVLLLLIILVLIAPFIYRSVSTSTYTMSVSDKIILDSLVHQISLRKEWPKAMPKTPDTPIELFAFDPNEATLDNFTTLGLPNYIAQRIINYRQAGGTFKTKADLKRIYGLSEEDFDRLYKYIQLPEKAPSRSASKNNPETLTFTKADRSKNVPERTKRVLEKIDINVCDTTDLKKLYGIGPVLAERIIKYRSLLGGFTFLEQLEEVYGLKEETLQELYENIFIDNTFATAKVAVNEADTKAMAAHPYISQSLAKAITAYRRQHGPFSTPESLLNIHILDSATFVKLKPYIGL